MMFLDDVHGLARKTNPLYREWYSLGTREPVGDFFEHIIVAIYSEICRSDDFVVDYGANWEMHTEPLSRLVGRNGRVWAIEALPHRASALGAHLIGNGFMNVTVVSKAIGARSGRARFSWVEGDDAYSGLKERNGIPEHAAGSVKLIPVDVTTLDQELSGRAKPIRFVKMDLEGGEYHSLLGARRILNQDRPMIIFENGRESMAKTYGYRRSDWFRMFHQARYRVFDLFGRPFLQSDWETPGIPWYSIAVPEMSPDYSFVSKRVPSIIECVAA